MYMLLLPGRIFLLLLLVADWAGDPYAGHSPLSRPFSSQEAFCHSMANRAAISRAMEPCWRSIFGFSSQALDFQWPDARRLVERYEADDPVLSAKDPFRFLMSLQC
jgi:hypothetical protein